MLRIISTCAPGPGDPGGEWRRETGGVGGEKDAWCYLPWLSLIPVQFPGRFRSGVAVRGERRHDALGFPSAARGFFAVARLSRLDGTVASGRVELDSAATRTTFAGLLDVSENHFGEYRALYMCCTSSHSSMVPLTVSTERGEGVLSARSRANLRAAFERPTSSRASKIVVVKTKMASRGAVGKSQLWCRKLDTRTSRYESSVVI